MSRTYEQILEPMSPFLAPIAGASPAGASAKFEPEYETLRGEVMKLDSPRGESVNWKVVLQSGVEILTAKSKDLLIGSHVAVALYHERGFAGLAEGTALLTELTSRYWAALFPPLARIRARVGAYEWYLDKTAIVFEQVKAPPEQDRAGLADLKVAVDKLRAVVAEKLADQAPALGPLREAVERLILSLPRAAVQPAPKPPAPATTSGVSPAPVPPAAPRPAPPASTSSAPPAAAHSSAPAADAPVATALHTPPAPAAGDDLAKFLQACGKSLVDAGSTLRAARPADPTAFRLIRSGMWLATMSAPPLGASGRTMIPPVTKEQRAKLDKLVETQSFGPLLEEAEGALLRNRLNLDLLRYSAQAMAALDGFAGARRVCIAELRTLLERVPSLPKLPTTDGSPLADDRSLMWLDEEVLAAKGGGATPRRSAPDINPEAMTSIQQLLAGGKAGEALAAFEGLAASAPDGRARARIRLAQAEACRKAGAAKVAEAIYEALDAELTAMHIDRWEPDLVVECLAGRLSCMRAGRKPGEAPKEEQSLYVRLAQLKPSLAFSLGT